MQYTALQATEAAAHLLQRTAFDLPLGDENATALYKSAAEILSDAILAAKPGETLRTNPWDAQLTIASIVDGTAILTTDGHGADRTMWHVGESDLDEWVYYEAWTAEGRVGHGYVDKWSRWVVQSG